MEKHTFRLNRKKFIQYLIGIEHHKLSGILTIQHSTGEDSYSIIQGQITNIKRSEQEEHEPLTIALGFGFAHKKAEGEFIPHPHLNTVDQSLLPSFSLFEAFWKGLQKHMPQAEIFSEINAVPREGLSLATPMLPPTYHNEAITDLFQLLTTPHSLQDINQKLSVKWSNFCSYGDLYRAVWLLFHCNKLSQALPFKNPLETKPTTAETTTESTQDTSKSKDIASFVQHEHSKRMGRDFYRFLGLKETANYSEIDTVGKKLIKTFTRIQNSKKLVGDDEKKVHELLQGTAMVLTHLLNPDMREEYNERKRQGRAPIVEIHNIHTQVPKEMQVSEEKKEHTYVQLIKEAKFAEAYPILAKLREEDSSNPDVLCDLGWVLWKSKQAFKEAEDYIRLALTFNNRHIRSYTYLSEIYIATENIELAQKFLTVLIKLQPQNQKAKQDLERITPTGDEKPQKGWFR